VIHLYAVASGLRGVPSLCGLEDATLEQRSVAGLDLVVSAHETAFQADEEAIMRHAQIVDAVMAQSDAVLPARFGRDFRDDTTLAEALYEHEARLREALERVTGCVELGVQVLGPDQAERPQPTGNPREYMSARLAQVAELDRVVADLHRPLAQRARGSVRRGGMRAQLVLSAAYLVPVEDVDDFRAELARLQRKHPELTVVCTGPWPPYSFAGSEGDV
jgi:hypothetical protein